MRLMCFVLLLAMAMITEPVKAAGDQEFLKFVFKQVKGASFTGCDSSVHDVFENVGGNDIRVFVTKLTDGKSGLADSLRVRAVYGSKGDVVVTDALFRKDGGRCWATVTTILQDEKSCETVANENTIWRLVSDTAAALETVNKGGVSRLLVPNGQRCNLIYTRVHSQ